MSVIHETKIEHALDAARDLSEGALPDLTKSRLIEALSQAYRMGENISEDHTGTGKIGETLGLLSRARNLLGTAFNDADRSKEMRTLIRKISEAEKAVVQFAAEI